MAVHVATVFSTLVIPWKDIVWIFKGLFDFKGPGMNESQRYALNILVSMIPVGIVGVFFKDYVEMIFGSGLLIVGICLLLTALLLTFSYYARPVRKKIYLFVTPSSSGFPRLVPCCPAYPVRYDHRYGLAVGKQQSQVGPVFFPDGDASYFRRSHTRCGKG